jgi:hypothetical protein
VRPKVQDCEERQRLLDTYLTALSREDNTRAAFRAGIATSYEISKAHERLSSTRSRYWKHVWLHNCGRH